MVKHVAQSLDDVLEEFERTNERRPVLDWAPEVGGIEPTHSAAGDWVG